MMQDAIEGGGELARLQRLHEQLADTGGERLLGQDRAAVAAHQYDRQVGPPATQLGCKPRPGEPGHDIVGDDDVERSGLSFEGGERGIAIGKWYRFVPQPCEYLGGQGEQTRLVLDEQYPLAVTAWQRGRRRIGGDERGLGLRQIDGKGAAVLGSALHVD